MYWYVETPKIHKNLIRANSREFSKDTGYKINTQQSVAYVYTNNKQFPKENFITIV
jgi:hypothetical protein